MFFSIKKCASCFLNLCNLISCDIHLKIGARRAIGIMDSRQMSKDQAMIAKNALSMFRWELPKAKKRDLETSDASEDCTCRHRFSPSIDFCPADCTCPIDCAQVQQIAPV